MTAIACKKAGLNFAGFFLAAHLSCCLFLLVPFLVPLLITPCIGTLYRSPWFVLDTCLWCGSNEQDTERKVCGAIRDSNTGECTSLSPRKCSFQVVLEFMVMTSWTVKSRFLYTSSIYHWSNPSFVFLVQLLESFQQSFPTLTFPPLPERGDFDLKEVLNSPYFFNWSSIAFPCPYCLYLWEFNLLPSTSTSRI